MDEESRPEDVPKPLMWGLRILLGCCGLFMIWKYLGQLPSGSITWASGEGEDVCTYLYRAETPAALTAAVITFGGWALGFMAFAISPRAALRMDWLIPWLILCMTAAITLHRL